MNLDQPMQRPKITVVFEDGLPTDEQLYHFRQGLLDILAEWPDCDFTFYWCCGEKPDYIMENGVQALGSVEVPGVMATTQWWGFDQYGYMVYEA